MMATQSHQPRGRYLDEVQSDVPGQPAQDTLSLLQLVRGLKRAMAPVQPAPSYKLKLLSDLDSVARHHVARDLVIAPASTSRVMLLAAAIGSLVALVGAIAYWLHVHAPGQARVRSRP